MAYVIVAILFFLIGRKYQEFSDVMLARRISRLVKSSDKIAKDQEDFERWEKHDRRIAKIYGNIDLEEH